MSLIWCPDINCQRDTIVCIYRCKLNVKCELYYKMYEIIKQEVVEQKYIDKYGEPVYPIPERIIQLEKRNIKRLKLQEKQNKINERNERKKERQRKKDLKEFIKSQKPRKRRTKLEMLEARTITLEMIEDKSEEVKPKRKRRTKLEMMAARTEQVEPTQPRRSMSERFARLV